MQGLTPSESRGVMVIVLVIALASIIRLMDPFANNTYSCDYTASDSIFTRISLSRFVAADPIDHNQKTVPKENKKTLIPGSIDINSARKSDLTKLPRIGPAIAQRIIDYRDVHGKFSTLKELKNVKGIGEKTLEHIRPYLKDIAE